MMGKFEIGQRLRVVDNSGAPRDYVKGEVGIVEKLYHRDMVRLAGKSAGMFERRFEPWVPKVGERVRFIKDNPNGGSKYGKKGDVVEVTVFHRFDGGPYGKQVEIIYPSCDFRPSAPISALEPVLAEVPTTLTIEAGKFYKARDGRKVGPMVARDGYLTADHFHYSANGECCYLGQSGDDTHPKRDLVAEWIDEPKASNDNGATLGDILQAAIGKSVTVQIDKPKFKVGDRVLSTEDGPTRGLSGTLVEDDKSVLPCKVRFDSWSGGHGQANNEWWIKADDITAPSSMPAIVCLIENGQPKPSSIPHIHADEAKAGKEAARLASVYKGKEFGVFVLTSSTSQPAPVYKHEWQRQAAAGNKISAIKELRAANDLTLKGAKDAVEHWLETAA